MCPLIIHLSSICLIRPVVPSQMRYQMTYLFLFCPVQLSGYILMLWDCICRLTKRSCRKLMTSLAPFPLLFRHRYSIFVFFLKLNRHRIIKIFVYEEKMYRLIGQQYEELQWIVHQSILICSTHSSAKSAPLSHSSLSFFARSLSVL